VPAGLRLPLLANAQAAFPAYRADHSYGSCLLDPVFLVPFLLTLGDVY
jgi:hypothetical protein